MTTTNNDSEKVYAISEASELTGVPPYLLRQWEERFPKLRPRRSNTGRRLYNDRDIHIIRRIKTLLKHEGMTSSGANTLLSKEIHERGRPKNTQEMLDILDRIADEARAIIGLYDPDTSEDTTEE